MSKHLDIETISAYLDGEHERPEDVRRHLQQCAECARDHVALQKLSAHVQALPECEVTVGFTARVMRAVEAPQSTRVRPRRFWVPIGAGLAAALAVVVGLIALDQDTASVDDRSTTTLIAIEPTPAPVPEVNLAGVLGPDGSERERFGMYGAGNDVQVAYASELATRPVPHEFFSGADYNESLVALDTHEKETLFQLLGSTLIDEQMM